MMIDKLEFINQKRAAVAAEIIECAMAVARDIPIAFPKKRIFPKRKRRPLKRKRKMEAKIRIFITPLMSAKQLHHILHQPLPKFPKGGLL